MSHRRPARREEGTRGPPARLRGGTRTGPPAALDILGTGPLQATLESLTAQLDLQQCVRFLGARPPGEVIARTARTDIYLQPSVTGPDGDCEGQPLVLLQAMAAARPCVVTRHEGITETLTDRHSAILVDENAAEPLAAAITMLAADPGIRRRLGLAAHLVATEQHSHDAARRRLLDLLSLGARIRPWPCSW